MTGAQNPAKRIFSKCTLQEYTVSETGVDVNMFFLQFGGTFGLVVCIGMIKKECSTLTSYCGEDTNKVTYQELRLCVRMCSVLWCGCYCRNHQAGHQGSHMRIEWGVGATLYSVPTQCFLGLESQAEPDFSNMRKLEKG